MLTLPASPTEFELLFERARTTWITDHPRWMSVQSLDMQPGPYLTTTSEFARVGPFVFYRGGEGIRFFSAPDHDIMFAWLGRQRDELLKRRVPAAFDDLPEYLTYLGTAPPDLVFTGPYDDPARNRLLEYILKVNSKRPAEWVRIPLQAVLSQVTQQAALNERSSATGV